MLRLAIVLPIYVTVMFFAPRLAAYDALADMLDAVTTTVGQALLDYSAALALAALLVWSTERWSLSPGVGAFVRVLRMGLLGVIVAAAWQIFCLISGTELSIIVMLIPAALLLAELAYELVEAMLGRVRSA